jgi:hypothetical protein
MPTLAHLVSIRQARREAYIKSQTIFQSKSVFERARKIFGESWYTIAISIVARLGEFGRFHFLMIRFPAELALC